MCNPKTVRLKTDNYDKLKLYCKSYGYCMKQGLEKMLANTSIKNIDIENRYLTSHKIKTTTMIFDDSNLKKIKEGSIQNNISENNFINLAVSSFDFKPN